jgi:hypothetical protein
VRREFFWTAVESRVNLSDGFEYDRILPGALKDVRKRSAGFLNRVGACVTPHLILIVSFFVGYTLSTQVLLVSNSMYCGSSWEMDVGSGLDGCTTM